LTDTPLEAALQRDRIIVAAALIVVTLLAWAYILLLAGEMGMADTAAGGMPGMDMPSMDMPGMSMESSSGTVLGSFRPWTPADFGFVLTMWAVMMVGMMTPSVAPMVLLYARAGREAARQGEPIAATGWFLAGYLLVWVGFSVLATGAQWALTRLALLTPAMTSASAIFGGILLIAAGLYQWTPIKSACLSQCQTPLQFLMRQGGFRNDPRGALALGARHGGYCLGCCWVLMALLFVGGVMNVLWIAGIAVLILLEKLVPTGRLVPRISGVVMVGAGIWLLAGSLDPSGL
jgi:predicted metal-binding membrane protein